MHKKIEEKLIQYKINYKEIRHDSFSSAIYSPADFANALSYEIERITKSVFLRTKTRDKYIMAVCSCGKKLDLRKLASLAKVNKLEVAEKQELADQIGYPSSGVCAIGIPTHIEVYLDEHLLTYPSILTGSGKVAVEIELQPKDLAALSNAVIAEIAIS